MPSKPNIFLRTDDRFVCVGTTGSGKTTFIQEAMLPAVPTHVPVVILDPKHEKKWKAWPDVPRNPLTRRFQLRDGLRCAYRWPEGPRGRLAEDADFHKFLDAVWKRGHILLICDETSALFDGAYTMTDDMGRIIREGRGKRISIWWLIQRPLQVPTIIKSEAEAWAVFTLRRRKDRQDAADYVGDDVEQLPPQTGERSHAFWWSRPGMAKPKLWQIRRTTTKEPTQEVAA